MKTVLTQQIEKLQTELKLKAALGRAYFDDEAQAMKFKLQELKAKLN